ncbi:transporter [Arenibacter latericius]|uniref:transporter n=1 Tax=Arenibacter latericius TaxID=86104 RepID=UPI0004020488|nr:transporter [Arenibacter latericius]MDX1362953.1 transporter [Arenibacter latericius]
MTYYVSKKQINLLFIVAAALIPFCGFSQYTEIINSNRPGLSVSAYALGSNVLQAELGVGYELRDHSKLATESELLSTDIALRYGLFFETLEISYEGTFDHQSLNYLNTGVEITNSDFSRNRIGLKLLVFDPFRNPNRNKPNLYSWKDNNKFKLKNLIPAISIYYGANFVFGDNPYYKGENVVSPRAMIVTQSRVTSKMELISNIAYDRIGTEFPEWNYTISLSHTLNNPRWSVFLENQGIKSDRYADILLRGGLAHLLSNNIQVDLNFGTNFKDTPSRIFGGIGMSYRLDMHEDKIRNIVH